LRFHFYYVSFVSFYIIQKHVLNFSLTFPLSLTKNKNMCRKLYTDTRSLLARVAISMSECVLLHFLARLPRQTFLISPVIGSFRFILIFGARQWGKGAVAPAEGSSQGWPPSAIRLGPKWVATNFSLICVSLRRRLRLLFRFLYFRTWPGYLLSLSDV